MTIYNKEKSFTKSRYWNFLVKENIKYDLIFKIKKYLQLIFKKYFKIQIHNISNQSIDQSFISFQTNHKIISLQSKAICQLLNNFFSKLKLNCKNIEYLKILEEYKKIFKKSNIKNLEGGIGFNNGLFIFVFNKLLNTKYFIESGSYRGFSSYLISSGVKKKQQILSFDINLSKLEWVSKNIKYFEQDIEKVNLNIEWKDSIIFYDDHYSHYDRLLFSYKKRVKYLIFDDDVNYFNLHSDGTPPVPTLSMIKTYKIMPKKFRWIFNNSICQANISGLNSNYKNILDNYHYITMPDIFDLTGYRNTSVTSFLVLK